MSSLARRCSARLAAYVRAVPSIGSSLMASPRSTPPSRCMASGAFHWARVYSSWFAVTYSLCLCICALVASGARSTIAGLRCSFLRSTIPRPCSCSTSRCPRCSSSTWHPQLAGQVFSRGLAPALVGLRALSLLASNVSNSRSCLLVQIQMTRVGHVLAGNCCLGASIPPILQESRFVRWQ